LQLGQPFSDELVARILPNSRLGIVSKKVSLNFYKILQNKLSSKNCEIVPLAFEPVERFVELKSTSNPKMVEQVSLDIAGVSADDKFLKFARKLKQDEVYVETNLENIAWFTNCRQYKMPYSSMFKAKMVVSKANATIYTNEEFANDVVIGKHFSLKPLKDFDYAFGTAKTVFYNPTTINFYDFCLIENKAKVADIDYIKELKSIKNVDELNHFKKNFERTDNVVNKIAQMLKRDEQYSEFDLYSCVEKEFLEQGAVQLSFNTILASGKNSSIIHYSKSSKENKVQNGDFVLLDCGGYFEGGYATDITRTFVKGEPSALQKKVYTTVLKMFLNAYHYPITNRTTGYTLDNVARKIHWQSDLSDFNFNHGLGHGVGVCVHENPPTISCGQLGRKVLKENMVFTIEPGLYKQGFGGVRLENTVYLTRDDNNKLCLKSFSKVPFQEDVIDYSLLNDQEKLWLKDWNNGKV
jgi:Xaa-Pro aminopeptidase